MGAKDNEPTSITIPRDQSANAVESARPDPARNGEYTPPARRELPPEFDAINARRHVLINKKIFGGGLTLEEEREFDRVTQEVDAMVESAFPYPKADLDYIARVEKELGLSGAALST